MKTKLAILLGLVAFVASGCGGGETLATQLKGAYFLSNAQVGAPEHVQLVYADGSSGQVHDVRADEDSDWCRVNLSVSGLSGTVSDYVQTVTVTAESNADCVVDDVGDSREFRYHEKFRVADADHLTGLEDEFMNTSMRIWKLYFTDKDVTDQFNDSFVIFQCSTDPTDLDACGYESDL